MATKRNKESFQDVLTKEILEDAFPPSPSPNTKTNEVINSLLSEEDVHGACFGFTGRFPQRSTSGNQYHLVGYHWDANYVHKGNTNKVQK